jgi:hypothetical protein
MPVKYSIKTNIFVLFGGLVCAAGMAFLANFILAGPRLGLHYDFLLEYRKPPPVSGEILIIETGDYIESSDIFSVLMTLTEMDAGNLIMTGKVSPSSSPVTITEAEIRQRFMDEYILIGTNIRNLFEAIRLGSVSPVNAPGYIDRLVELTDQGRDRLLAALINRDVNFFRSIAVFGNYLEADTAPVLDKDGKVRRVLPIESESLTEHPVFISLKNRYAASQIETADQEQILWLLNRDGTELDIPLDRNANIITPWNCNFRRIDISLFREYEEAELAMRSALAKANELGAFSQTLPEKSPLILCDFALKFKEELLNSPGVEKRSAWIAGREKYFKSLDEFFESRAEADLVRGYNDVIADEKLLGEEGLAALAKMRDQLMQSFTNIRDEYDRLYSVHSKLKEELAMSFCVLGRGINAEYSALLANALITGSHIKPVYDRYALIFSAATAFFILLVIFYMRPSVLLIFGIFLSAIASAVFGIVFIYYSYWIDPAIVFVSSVTGTLVIFYIKCAVKDYRARHFRIAYGPSVSQDTLNELICAGRPSLSDVIVTNAAVVAIKNNNLLSSEDKEKPHDAGKAKKAFFSLVKKTVSGYGAIIAGFEGDTVLACFGSPLDKSEDPLNRACGMVADLLNDERKSWNFGIDAGECTFYWMPETGYSVNGKPAVRARVASSKTRRLEVRSIVTETVWLDLNLKAKKLGSLYDGSEAIYEYPVVGSV